jgi:bacterioferritin
LFEQLMTDEEGHIDFPETQLDLIGRIGLERCTQARVNGLGEGGTPGLRGNS